MATSQSRRFGVTLADVAAEAGVSVSAVSKVLLGGGGKTTKVGKATAGRIVEAAGKLGYRPNAAARQLRTGRSRIVGAIIHGQAPQVMYARLSAIQQKLAALGYGFMVGETDGTLPMLGRYLDEFRSRGAELILNACPGGAGHASSLQALYAGHENLLFLGRPELSGAAFVECDIADGVRQLVEHLVSRGVRRIALNLTNRGNRTIRQREEGYRDALRRHGLPARAEWIVEYGAGPDDGAGSARCLADLGVEAVIASNDQRAIRLIHDFAELGIRVPEHLRVTGYDNQEFSAYCRPPLTTVDQRNERVAEDALDMIRHFLEQGRFPPSRRVKPRLIVRESA